MKLLRRKTQIDRVFTEGCRFYSPWVALQVRRRSHDEDLPAGPRVTVITGRRFRTAVERNQAKRLLRETCRAVLGKNQGPWDLVLIARNEVLSIPFGERVRVLSRLLREAGVLDEKAAAAV